MIFPGMHFVVFRNCIPIYGIIALRVPGCQRMSACHECPCALDTVCWKHRGIRRGTAVALFRDLHPHGRRRGIGVLASPRNTSCRLPSFPTERERRRPTPASPAAGVEPKHFRHTLSLRRIHQTHGLLRRAGFRRPACSVGRSDQRRRFGTLKAIPSLATVSRTPS
jgi:hypothetical protein